jgi:hypothetical protein
MRTRSVLPLLVLLGVAALLVPAPTAPPSSKPMTAATTHADIARPGVAPAPKTQHAAAPAKTWHTKGTRKLTPLPDIALPAVPAVPASGTSATTTVPFHPVRQGAPSKDPSAHAATASSGSNTATPAAEAAQTAGPTDFLAAQFVDDSDYEPPDSMGAAGLTQILVAVNGRIRTFTKTGTADGALDESLDTFFGQSVSDPHVRYDRGTGRWFITAITTAQDTGNFIVLAASTASTITPSMTWRKTGFASAAEPGTFLDFDTLGVDAQALYIGANVFSDSSGSTLVNTDAWVFDKAKLLGGKLAGFEVGDLIDFNQGVGPVAPEGVDNLDTGTNAGYIAGVDGFYEGEIDILRIDNPIGSNPTATGYVVDVPTTQIPNQVPQPGASSPNLDAGDDRIANAVIRNGRLWTSHNIEVNSTGVSGSGDRIGVRWYQFSNLTSTPSLAQSGTIYDPGASPNFSNYWMPSVAVSGQGHAAFGFSVGGADATHGFASVGTAGRLATDAAGVTSTPVVTDQSTFLYNPHNETIGTARWGDYSYTSVDPADDMTMWTVQEYTSALNKWGVRVVQLRAPAPTISTVSSVPTGQTSVPLTVTGTGFFEPGTSFPNHLMASATGGVVINKVASVSPTSVTLDVNTAGASLGNATVTITNPDGQATTAAPFTVSATVACGPVCADFNGDGKPDVIWHNTGNGKIFFWFLSGTTYVNGVALTGSQTSASSAWVPVATADYNADGKPDILWHNRNDGRVFFWFLNGTTYASGSGASGIANGASLDWVPVASGDYNGDGKPDIMWWNKKNGRIYFWFLHGTSYYAGAAISGSQTSASSAWVPSASADYNHDNKPDILWHNKTDGRVFFWFLNGTAYTGGAAASGLADRASLAWVPEASADYNGDSTPDIMWHNTSDGRLYFWFLDGTTYGAGGGLSGAMTKASLSWVPF